MNRHDTEVVPDDRTVGGDFQWIVFKVASGLDKDCDSFGRKSDLYKILAVIPDGFEN